jgi:hypothetical protein
VTTCVVLELADGSARAFAYADASAAATWYRRFWPGGGPESELIFYVRVPGGARRDVIPARDVTHVELCGLEDVLDVDLNQAFIT